MARHGIAWKTVGTAGLGLLVLLTTLPAVGSQAEPYPGCSDSPGTCTPQGVNGGVRTGNATITTLLYAHFLGNLLEQAPLNTEPPDPDHEEDVDAGFLMPTIVTEDERLPCCRFPNNEFKMFFSPGPVEFLDEGVRVHHESLLGAPLTLGGDIVSYSYFSADSVPDAVPEQDSTPGVMPALGTYLRMEIGRHPWQGTLIAEGDSGLGFRSPDMGSAPGATTMISAPGQDVVYEFVTRMSTTPITLEPTDGFVVTMVPYQVREDGVAEFTSADWRLRSGPEFPHRLHIPSKPPLSDVGASLSQTQDGSSWFRWSIMASYGPYDADVSTLQATLTDSGGAPLEAELAKVRWPYNAHGSVEPMNITWTLAENREPLPDGDYRLSVSVMNLQGTYRLERNTTILVEDGVPRLAAEGETLAATGDAAAPAAAAVAAALTAALIAARPRRRSGKP